MDGGMRFIVLQQFKREYVRKDGEKVEVVTKEHVDLDVGDCFKCGYEDLRIGYKFGILDNKPSYIQCPRCKAINNFRSRVYAE